MDSGDKLRRDSTDPTAPDSPGHASHTLLFSPSAGLVDRARDTLTGRGKS